MWIPQIIKSFMSFAMMKQAKLISMGGVFSLFKKYVFDNVACEQV